MHSARYSDEVWIRISEAVACRLEDAAHPHSREHREGRFSRHASYGLACLVGILIGGTFLGIAPRARDAAFLSKPSTEGSSVVTVRKPIEDSPLKSVAAVALSLASVVSAQSGVIGWGRNEFGQASPPPGLQHSTRLSAGLYHSLALQPDGSIIAWGRNDNGQCDVPEDLGAVVEIHAAFQHSAALEQGGRVRCFGANTHGQCSVPSDMIAARSIAVGDEFTIAVLADGTVRCWGLNTSQQCEVPKSASGIVNAAGGAAFVVAQQASGGLLAWGRNDFGQCDIPADVGTTIQVVAGAWHGIALRADGTVRTWGRNEFGQLDVPSDIGPVVAIAGDRSNVTMVLQADGTVRAWGQWNRVWNDPSPPSNGAPWRAVACGGYHAIGLPRREPCAGDLDGDGATDASDLAELLGNWGACP